MKQLDKLKTKAMSKKKIIIFLITLFLIGIFSGSLFIVILNNTDKELVNVSLETFLRNIENGKLNYLDAFISSLGRNLFYTILIWLFGISVIGIPIILFIYFSKAFMLGFSISSILYHYKLKGSIIALFYLFPHHIISVLIYTLLLIYAIRLSVHLSKVVFYKKSIDFKVIMRRYLVILGIAIIGTILASILEVFFMPTMLRFIIPFIK